MNVKVAAQAKVFCFAWPRYAKMDGMNDEQYPEDLSPENYPKGAPFLPDEFYWDCTDENSPFGNDTGADTFSFFREWREEHSRTNPIKFLDELLENWEVVNDHWDVVDHDEAQSLFEEDEFSFSTRDDAVIALAFGQILLSGKVHSEVKRRALLALDRQSSPQIVSTMWGPGNAPERFERLEKMKGVLSQQ